MWHREVAALQPSNVMVVHDGKVKNLPCNIADDVVAYGGSMVPITHIHLYKK